MEKDFCVEFVDQCGGVFITHPSIKSAKQHLAELPQIPNAQQNLKQLGVEVLNIVVKLDSSVGVCVGQIKLDPKLAIKLDDTWREVAPKCGAQKWQNLASKAMDCHATHAAYNDRKRAGFWKTLKVWLAKMLKDSRIFDEFCALREKAQGSYLSGNDRRAFLTLAQKSQKAESKS